MLYEIHFDYRGRAGHPGAAAEQVFLGLAVVLLLYGTLVLHGVTILGVAHTAPFSPWSFGDCLFRMLPLLWSGMLFFLAFFTSPKARRAAALTEAVPMPRRTYALARCGAALTGVCCWGRKQGNKQERI